ncbi:hypothetical protein ACTFIT_008238, partial [Dictyostelium discoideum]
YFR